MKGGVELSIALITGTYTECLLSRRGVVRIGYGWQWYCHCQLGQRFRGEVVAGTECFYFFANLN